MYALFDGVLWGGAKRFLFTRSAWKKKRVKTFAFSVLLVVFPLRMQCSAVQCLVFVCVFVYTQTDRHTHAHNIKLLYTSTEGLSVTTTTTTKDEPKSLSFKFPVGGTIYAHRFRLRVYSQSQRPANKRPKKKGEYFFFSFLNANPTRVVFFFFFFCAFLKRNNKKYGSKILLLCRRWREGAGEVFLTFCSRPFRPALGRLLTLPFNIYPSMCVRLFKCISFFRSYLGVQRRKRGKKGRPGIDV